MDGGTIDLLKSAASQLKGAQRREFLAQVCTTLCDGNPRRAEREFGWGRATVAKGMEEAAQSDSGQKPPKSRHRGKMRSEVANPQLAVDIQAICEPHTHTDPELKSERAYTNLTAAEVRQELARRGYSDDQLPSERTLRDILNRMNYRLKRIQKGKPLKKTQDTDAIFENIKAIRAEAGADETALEISIDTKTNVKLGEYSLGGKNENPL